MIQLSFEQGSKQRAIARCLDRAPNWISRALRRNGWRAPEPAAKKGRPGRPLLAGGYRTPLAQQRTRTRHLAGTAQQPVSGWTRRGGCGRRSHDCCVSRTLPNRSRAYCEA
ncbi:MAG: helix-turn-helix domain-containing protein [Burkholderia sp.]